jgi:hypothetical protein
MTLNIEIMREYTNKQNHYQNLEKFISQKYEN